MAGDSTIAVKFQYKTLASLGHFYIQLHNAVFLGKPFVILIVNH